MAGYLDTYGVSDQKRERLTKKIVIALLITAVVGLSLFLFFRNFSEKRVAGSFFDALRANDHREAYRIWGCTEQTPCRDYSFEKFMEDWGPQGAYSNIHEARVTTVDACGEGVVLTVSVPNVEPFGIWVERSTHTMSFAPWPRCPGRHLRIWEFLKNRFS
jgi:hypothetical protein